MAIPPGIRYLVQRSPQILAGPLLGFLVLYISERYLDYETTTRQYFYALVFGFPIFFTVTLAINDLKDYLRAKAAGARLPKRIQDYSPGGIWSIVKEIRTEKYGYLADNIEETAEYCGGYTFNLRMLFQNRMITMEPEHIKAILATEFDSYEKGAEVCNVLQTLLGSGVFAVDGELWKFHRSMTRPFFTRDRISDFDNFERHAEDAINQIKARLKEGYAVDIQDMTARFTLDSATEFLFGNDVRSLAAGIPYPYNSALAKDNAIREDPATQFANAFADAQRLTLARIRLGLNWPLAEFWKDEMEEKMKVVYGMIDPIVDAAVEDKKKPAQDAQVDFGDDKLERTLLEQLVDSTEDKVLLRDAIMSLLVAGRDTTASLLTFVTYMLAEYPDVLARLRQEILNVVGPSKRPTYEDIRDLKYLKAVINETLRLYPAVPFNLRMSKAEPTLWAPNKPGSKPFYIPANTRIGYTILGMHRRKDLWGPDADEFDPDRFLDERLHKYLTPNPFIFLPFNAGPRICLGQQFAYNEASFFLVRMLQNFSKITIALDAQPPDGRAPASWSSAEGRKGKEKIKPRSHLTMHLDGGLWVMMEEA